MTYFWRDEHISTYLGFARAVKNSGLSVEVYVGIMRGKAKRQQTYHGVASAFKRFTKVALKLMEIPNFCHVGPKEVVDIRCVEDVASVGVLGILPTFEEMEKMSSAEIAMFIDNDRPNWRAKLTKMLEED